jgi:hypothetical protein
MLKEQRGLVRAGDLLPEVLSAGLFDEVIRPEDVGYTHPVFLQCFLPTRHSAKNKQRWQTNCGLASLVIRAGELANPAKLNEYETCLVPAGPKARFVIGSSTITSSAATRRPSTWATAPAKLWTK